MGIEHLYKCRRAPTSADRLYVACMRDRMFLDDGEVEDHFHFNRFPVVTRKQIFSAYIRVSLNITKRLRGRYIGGESRELWLRTSYSCSNPGPSPLGAAIIRGGRTISISSIGQPKW
jgi:hypothetical protein